MRHDVIGGLAGALDLTVLDRFGRRIGTVVASSGKVLDQAGNYLGQVQDEAGHVVDKAGAWVGTLSAEATKKLDIDVTLGETTLFDGEITLPQMPELPKVEMPDMPTVEMPELPKVDIPRLKGFDLPPLPQAPSIKVKVPDGLDWRAVGGPLGNGYTAVRNSLDELVGHVVDQAGHVMDEAGYVVGHVNDSAGHVVDHFGRYLGELKFDIDIKVNTKTGVVRLPSLPKVNNYMIPDFEKIFGQTGAFLQDHKHERAEAVAKNVHHLVTHGDKFFQSEHRTFDFPAEWHAEGSNTVHYHKELPHIAGKIEKHYLKRGSVHESQSPVRESAAAAASPADDFVATFVPSADGTPGSIGHWVMDQEERVHYWAFMKQRGMVSGVVHKDDIIEQLENALPPSSPGFAARPRHMAGVVEQTMPAAAQVTAEKSLHLPVPVSPAVTIRNPSSTGGGVVEKLRFDSLGKPGSVSASVETKSGVMQFQQLVSEDLADAREYVTQVGRRISTTRPEDLPDIRERFYDSASDFFGRVRGTFTGSGWKIDGGKKVEMSTETTSMSVVPVVKTATTSIVGKNPSLVQPSIRVRDATGKVVTAKPTMLDLHTPELFNNLPSSADLYQRITASGEVIHTMKDRLTSKTLAEAVVGKVSALEDTVSDGLASSSAAVSHGSGLTVYQIANGMESQFLGVMKNAEDGLVLMPRNVDMPRLNMGMGSKSFEVDVDLEFVENIFHRQNEVGKQVRDMVSQAGDVANSTAVASAAQLVRIRDATGHVIEQAPTVVDVSKATLAEAAADMAYVAKVGAKQLEFSVEAPELPNVNFDMVNRGGKAAREVLSELGEMMAAEHREFHTTSQQPEIATQGPGPSSLHKGFLDLRYMKSLVKEQFTGVASDGTTLVKPAVVRDSTTPIDLRIPSLRHKLDGSKIIHYLADGSGQAIEGTSRVVGEITNPDHLRRFNDNLVVTLTEGEDSLTYVVNKGGEILQASSSLFRRAGERLEEGLENLRPLTSTGDVFISDGGGLRGKYARVGSSTSGAAGEMMEFLLDVKLFADEDILRAFDRLVRAADYESRAMVDRSGKMVHFLVDAGGKVVEGTQQVVGHVHETINLAEATEQYALDRVSAGLSDVSTLVSSGSGQLASQAEGFRHHLVDTGKTVAHYVTDGAGQILYNTETVAHGVQGDLTHRWHLITDKLGQSQVVAKDALGNVVNGSERAAGVLQYEFADKAKMLKAVADGAGTSVTQGVKQIQDDVAGGQQILLEGTMKAVEDANATTSDIISKTNFEIVDLKRMDLRVHSIVNRTGDTVQVLVDEAGHVISSTGHAMHEHYEAALSELSRAMLYGSRKLSKQPRNLWEFANDVAYYGTLDALDLFDALMRFAHRSVDSLFTFIRMPFDGVYLLVTATGQVVFATVQQTATAFTTLAYGLGENMERVLGSLMNGIRESSESEGTTTKRVRQIKTLLPGEENLTLAQASLIQAEDTDLILEADMMAAAGKDHRVTLVGSSDTKVLVATTASPVDDAVKTSTSSTGDASMTMTVTTTTNTTTPSRVAAPGLFGTVDSSTRTYQLERMSTRLIHAYERMLQVLRDLLVQTGRLVWNSVKGVWELAVMLPVRMFLRGSQIIVDGLTYCLTFTRDQALVIWNALVRTFSRPTTPLQDTQSATANMTVDGRHEILGVGVTSTSSKATAKVEQISIEANKNQELLQARLQGLAAPTDDLDFAIPSVRTVPGAATYVYQTVTGSITYVLTFTYQEATAWTKFVATAGQSEAQKPLLVRGFMYVLGQLAGVGRAVCHYTIYKPVKGLIDLCMSFATTVSSSITTRTTTVLRNGRGGAKGDSSWLSSLLPSTDTMSTYAVPFSALALLSAHDVYFRWLRRNPENVHRVDRHLWFLPESVRQIRNYLRFASILDAQKNSSSDDNVNSLNAKNANAAYQRERARKVLREEFAAAEEEAGDRVSSLYIPMPYPMAHVVLSVDADSFQHVSKDNKENWEVVDVHSLSSTGYMLHKLLQLEEDVHGLDEVAGFTVDGRKIPLVRPSRRMSQMQNLRTAAETDFANSAKSVEEGNMLEIFQRQANTLVEVLLEYGWDYEQKTPAAQTSTATPTMNKKSVAPRGGLGLSAILTAPAGVDTDEDPQTLPWLQRRDSRLSSRRGFGSTRSSGYRAESEPSASQVIRRDSDTDEQMDAVQQMQQEELQKQSRATVSGGQKKLSQPALAVVDENSAAAEVVTSLQEDEALQQEQEEQRRASSAYSYDSRDDSYGFEPETFGSQFEPEYSRETAFLPRRNPTQAPRESEAAPPRESSVRESPAIYEPHPPPPTSSPPPPQQQQLQQQGRRSSRPASPPQQQRKSRFLSAFNFFPTWESRSGSTLSWGGVDNDGLRGGPWGPGRVSFRARMPLGGLIVFVFETIEDFLMFTWNCVRAFLHFAKTIIMDVATMPVTVFTYATGYGGNDGRNRMSSAFHDSYFDSDAALPAGGGNVSRTNNRGSARESTVSERDRRSSASSNVSSLSSSLAKNTEQRTTQRVSMVPVTVLTIMGRMSENSFGKLFEYIGGSKEPRYSQTMDNIPTGNESTAVSMTRFHEPRGAANMPGGGPRSMELQPLTEKRTTSDEHKVDIFAAPGSPSTFAAQPFSLFPPTTTSLIGRASTTLGTAPAVAGRATRKELDQRMNGPSVAVPTLFRQNFNHNADDRVSRISKLPLDESFNFHLPADPSRVSQKALQTVLKDGVRGFARMSLGTLPASGRTLGRKQKKMRLSPRGGQLYNNYNKLRQAGARLSPRISSPRAGDNLNRRQKLRKKMGLGGIKKKKSPVLGPKKHRQVDARATVSQNRPVGLRLPGTGQHGHAGGVGFSEETFSSEGEEIDSNDIVNANEERLLNEAIGMTPTPSTPAEMIDLLTQSRVSTGAASSSAAPAAQLGSTNVRKRTQVKVRVSGQQPNMSSSSGTTNVRVSARLSKDLGAPGQASMPAATSIGSSAASARPPSRGLTDSALPMRRSSDEKSQRAGGVSSGSGTKRRASNASNRSSSAAAGIQMGAPQMFYKESTSRRSASLVPSAIPVRRVAGPGKIKSGSGVVKKTTAKALAGVRSPGPQASVPTAFLFYTEDGESDDEDEEEVVEMKDVDEVGGQGQETPRPSTTPASPSTLLYSSPRVTLFYGDNDSDAGASSSKDLFAPRERKSDRLAKPKAHLHAQHGHHRGHHGVNKSHHNRPEGEHVMGLKTGTTSAEGNHTYMAGRVTGDLDFDATSPSGSVRNKVSEIEARLHGDSTEPELKHTTGGYQLQGKLMNHAGNATGLDQTSYTSSTVVLKPVAQNLRFQFDKYAVSTAAEVAMGHDHVALMWSPESHPHSLVQDLEDLESKGSRFGRVSREHLLSGVCDRLRQYVSGTIESRTKELFAKKELFSSNTLVVKDFLTKKLLQNQHDINRKSKKAHEINLLSPKDIERQVLSLTVTSWHTSSHILTWAMSELLTNPFVLNKLRKEVDAVDPASVNTVQKLTTSYPYMEHVILETLRLHPVNGGFSEGRSPMYTNDELPDGTFLYSGTHNVFVFAADVVNRQNWMWTLDADVFAPDRWSYALLERSRGGRGGSKTSYGGLLHEEVEDDVTKNRNDMRRGLLPNVMTLCQVKVCLSTLVRKLDFRLVSPVKQTSLTGQEVAQPLRCLVTARGQGFASRKVHEITSIVEKTTGTMRYSVNQGVMASDLAGYFPGVFTKSSEQQQHAKPPSARAPSETQHKGNQRAAASRTRSSGLNVADSVNGNRQTATEKRASSTRSVKDGDEEFAKYAYGDSTPANDGGTTSGESRIQMTDQQELELELARSSAALPGNAPNGDRISASFLRSGLELDDVLQEDEDDRQFRNSGVPTATSARAATTAARSSAAEASQASRDPTLIATAAVARGGATADEVRASQWSIGSFNMM
ncbi:unnamed protein product [Amoebophrya sp. A25]|nr:unnamed protein product [Amoebophrya sp. A25]|eukprot:GSA25T00004058001.1